MLPRNYQTIGLAKSTSQPQLYYDGIATHEKHFMIDANTI